MSEAVRGQKGTKSVEVSVDQQVARSRSAGEGQPRMSSPPAISQPAGVSPRPGLEGLGWGHPAEAPPGPGRGRVPATWRPQSVAWR